MKNLYIIDNMNLIFRMFFWIPPMSHNGNLTNMVYWYLRTLKTIHEHWIKETWTSPMILVATDVKSDVKGFRDELFAEYKANRVSKMPDECRNQVPLLTELLKILEIPIIGYAWYEADDVIWTISKNYAKDFNHCYILSSDKDLCQLIDEKVSCMDAQKQTVWNNKNIFNKFNVRKDQIVDYLSLVGDSSDNIPWVSWIGEKTAVTILEKFDGIDSLYKQLGENLVKEKILTNSVFQKLQNWKDSAFLSKKLATIVTDLEVNFIEQIFDINKIYLNENFQLFCEKVNFKTFLKKNL